MTRSEKWRILLRVLAIVVPLASLIGVLLGWIISGTGASIVAGAVIGFLVSLGIVAFDVSWALGLIPRGWREAPFLVVILSRSLVWLTVIVVGISVPLLIIAGVSMSDLVDAQFRTSVVISFVAALLFNFVAQVNRLLGRGVLIRLILGRYHRPREEERVFLLVDLRGSTGIAEQLGNLRYHAFLRRFISDITESVVRFHGEVHRYVGDEVILTWTAKQGLHDAACIKAVFAMSDILAEARTEYESEFGVVPDYWAGLHLGSVVTGEVGTIKQEIAFLGDTLNAAARIQQATREFDRRFLASAVVIDAIDLPSDISAESLGNVELRGIEDPIELYSIRRVAAGP